MASSSGTVATTKKIAAFLEKLYTLCNSDCPPEVGEFEAGGGSCFVVRDTARFQELLRNYYSGSLQTFIRQLHFYGFSKHDLPNSASFTFSHEFFLKGQPDLLGNIVRRKQQPSSSSSSTNLHSSSPAPLAASSGVSSVSGSSAYHDVGAAGLASAARALVGSSSANLNGKIRTASAAFGSSSIAAAHPGSSMRFAANGGGGPAAGAIDYEARAQIEVLMREVQELRQELAIFKDLDAVKSLLTFDEVANKRVRMESPAPGGTGKSPAMPHRALRGPPSSAMSTVSASSSTTTTTSSSSSNGASRAAPAVPALYETKSLKPPPALTRGLSAESHMSHFSVRDFPFEDTSSMGSVSTSDLMRELRLDFAGMEDEMAVARPEARMGGGEEGSTGGSGSGIGSGPDSTTEMNIKHAKKTLVFPEGFVCPPEVTPKLVKRVFEFIANLCGCGSTLMDSENRLLCDAIASLKAVTDLRPDPATLKAAGECAIGEAMLPLLRTIPENEGITDMQLKVAARCCYEIFYYRYAEKSGKSSSSSSTTSSTSATPTASYTSSSVDNMNIKSQAAHSSSNGCPFASSQGSNDSQ